MVMQVALPDVPREPSAEELMVAQSLIQRGKDILLAGRKAVIRRKRAEELAARRPVRRFPMVSCRCSWCGVGFRARRLNRPVRGRFCSHSCREMDYQARKRRVAKRDAARAAVLAVLAADGGRP